MLPDVLAYGSEGYGDEILAGAWLTLQLALASLVFGLAMGLATAAGKLSRNRAARWSAEAYTVVIRGIPEFLIVLLIFFGSNTLVGLVAGLFTDSGGFGMNRFLAGTIALGLVFGAFASEVFRGAFLAVPKGQFEAGIACGMTPRQVFFRIRMPQMWRYAIPGLGNLWMVLLKDTSLISVIALDELLRWSKVGAESTRQPFTFYIAAAVIYLLMTAVSDLFRQRLEARASRGVRTA